MYVRKTRDFWEVQAKTEQGFETVYNATERPDGLAALKSHRINDPKTSYRMIKSRERIES